MNSHKQRTPFSIAGLWRERRFPMGTIAALLLSSWLQAVLSAEEKISSVMRPETAAVAGRTSPAAPRYLEQKVTRLARPLAPVSFQALPPGYAQRWLAKLSNPTFCRFPICHGTCASLNHSWTGVDADPAMILETPCSLPLQSLLSRPDAGCCSHESSSCHQGRKPCPAH